MLITLVYFSFLLCDSKNIQENLYLAAPYVDSKGSSNVVRFLQDFVIKSHGTNDQGIQLAYTSPGSVGALVYKDPIGSDKFSVDFSIFLTNKNTKKGNKGLLIFFSKSDVVEEGPLYGRDGNVEGLLIAVDTTDPKKPYVSAAAGDIQYIPEDHDKIFKKRASLEQIQNEKYTIRVVQNNRRLQVFLIDDYDDETEIYNSKNILIGENYYIGMVADNGSQGLIAYNILSIAPSHLKYVAKDIVKGEGESSSTLIWIIFAVGLSCIGYYLYSLQSKRKTT